MILPPRVRSFDEVFEDHNLTEEERRELVFRLASMRYQKTVEALLHTIPKRPLSYGILRNAG